MKKLLLSCFLAFGIGANAQFNYTADPGTDPAAIPFAVLPTAVTAACIGNGASQPASATYTQIGIGINLGLIGQTNNGQAATVSVSYKKAGTGTGTMYLTLFEVDPGGTTWDIVTLASANITATAITACETLTATIPAGVLKTDGSKDYAYGYFFARTGGSSTITSADYKIVQEVVSTAPSCTTVSAPVAGSTVNAGSLNIIWNPTATATGYKLTVGTSSGASDVFSGTITGGITNKFVTVEKNKTYFVKVVSTNANGDATGCTEITFNTDGTVAYCASSVSATSDIEPITNVTFAGINNTTSPTINGTPEHELFLDQKASVIRGGAPVPISVKGNSGGNYANLYTVFIDWNQDGSFDQVNEKYYTGVAGTPTGSATLTISNSTGVDTKVGAGTIMVPADAKLGDTRMRVIKQYNAPVTGACAVISFGQAEDYTVTVNELTLPTCTTVTAATPQAPNTTLAWTADAMASGYKVYVGITSGGTEIANGTLVTTTSFEVTGLARNTTYFAKVVPSNSLGDASGCAEISFTTPADFTYCVATHTTVNADRMSKVVFADIDNASTVTTIPGGYEDFTAVVGSVEKEGTYPISITVAGGNANDKVKVWIDYNQNGVFDDSEMTLLTYVSTTSTTGSITIPATALYGNTRMRIRLARKANATDIVACGNLTNQGRTQDYTIKVIEPTAATSSVTKSTTSVYPNPFQDVLKISDVKGVKSISVSDVSGRQVKNMKPSAELNLSDLKTGMYIVTLHMEDGTVKSFKTIKK